MSRDDVIEKAAQLLAAKFGGQVEERTGEARALADAGLLVDEQGRHISIDAADLAGLDSDLLRSYAAKATWAGCGLTALITGRVAAAILASRGESA